MQIQCPEALCLTVAHHGQKVKMRFSVLGASNVKSIFCMRDFHRQLYKFQNDILELHVALAKKKVHLFEKYKENP